MGIKLVDEIFPMGSFPVTKSQYIECADGTDLETKLSTIGGGGTSITVDTAMSSTSTNPVQNKVIKAYVDGKSVDISADSDNAIQTKTDGIYVEKTKISTDDGNALSKKSDGLFVEDLSNKVNALNIAQKTVNSELEYYYATKTTSISGVSIKDSNLINYLPYLTNITSNLEPSRYNTKGVTLKKSKTYRITFGLARATTSGNGTSAYVMDSNGNKLGNRGYFGSNSYSDNIIDVIYTPTKDISVYPALVNLNTNLGSTYYPDCSFFQITEIGREVIIDPVEYVDSTKGIEDTPVGGIITKIGSAIPAHYLPCDGTIYNILDYPKLAQCIKDEFGSTNYYGGDGITTFGVPNKSTYTWWTPGLVNGVVPSPYAVYVSSVFNTTQYQKELLFDRIISKDSCWHSKADGSDTDIWVKFDFGKNTYIQGLRMAARSDNYLSQLPSTFTIEGSYDDVTYTVIKSYSRLPNPTSTNFREHLFDKPVSYRYYKLNHMTSNSKNDGHDYCSIAELEFAKIDSMLHIKYEPTYYMQNTFNINDVYSTDEMIIGKWIDGKPIYSKMFYSENSDFATATQFPAPYAEKLVEYSPMYRNDYNNFFPESMKLYNKGQANAYFQETSRSYAGGTYWIAKYTKATD